MRIDPIIKISGMDVANRFAKQHFSNNQEAHSANKAEDELQDQVESLTVSEQLDQQHRGKILDIIV